jgi:hypothetical protein
MGDRLEYVNGRNYQRIDNGLGSASSWITVSALTTNTCLPPAPTTCDMNLVRLRYDF